MNFPDLGLTISLPTISGIASQGIFATIAYVLELIFGLMVLIWVGYSIYAGYKIITNSEAKGIEEGIKIIKNIWIGISIGLLFFVVLSITGSVMGVGDITRWHIGLAQCNDASGGFYFKDVQEQIVAGLPETNNDVYCCKVKKDLKGIEGDPGTFYNHSSFKKDTWHYIVVNKGETTTSLLFSDCKKF